MRFNSLGWVLSEGIWLLLCYCTALAIFAWYLLCLQPGHEWGDDFAQYIIHAKNIAEGFPYKDTGHIINPANSIAPEAYPPVFPLLLAPVYAVWGLNLVALKTVVIICFAIFLSMIYTVFRTAGIPSILPFAIILIIGLNPVFFIFKENILTEYPFMMFLFLCFGLIKRAHSPALKESEAWFLYIATGVCLYLIYGTRSVGIVMVPAFIAYEVLKRNKSQKWFQKVFLSLIIFAFLIVLQNWYLNSSGEGYIYQLKYFFTKDTIPANAVIFKNELSELWKGYNYDIRKAIFKGGLTLAVVGWMLCVWKRFTVAELFVPGFILIILVWPMNQGLRFLMPLIPFFFFYILFTLYFLFMKSKKAFYSSATWVTLFLLLPHIGTYKEIKGYSTNGFLVPETLAVFEFARKTDPESRFIFVKPRALTLFSNREAATFHCETKPNELSDFFNDGGFDYLVIHSTYTLENEACLRAWIKDNPDRLKMVFSNEYFLIYKLINKLD